MIKKNFFKNKRVLVAGGTGLIGMQLCDKLIKLGANITVVSLDDFKSKKNLKFVKADLRNFDNCIKLTKNKNIVFNLAGVKGSPKMTIEKPASFFVPTLMFSVNLMEAARKNRVENYLFTSSIGVYSPKSKFVEDDVWKTYPSKNDKYAGWAKRICELQSEVYEIQYNWRNISVVRPANVYGPYDNFDINNAMVIPSLIYKALKAKKNLEVWGDGKNVRDFIFSSDVADGMLLAVKKNINYPINLGSGKKNTIKDVVNIINNNLPGNKLEIKWDTSKPSGDKIRLMDIRKAQKIGFKPRVTLKEGIKITMDWFLNSKQKRKYNAFTE